MELISTEARRLRAAMLASPVAFSYFDAADRLVYWNRAYEDLNFRIRHLIRKGAFFSDLLAELVAQGQVLIEGDAQEWVEERLRARQLGKTAFRHLGDGRVFLVQERRDEVGGTLGFWVDVSDLFSNGALRDAVSPIAGSRSRLADPGYQDLLRGQLQTILCNLELIRGALSDELAHFVDDALVATAAIAGCLDLGRETAE